MGICTFCHYINKYGYYIIRTYSSFYIVNIRLPKHNKPHINLNITHKVKLTPHPLAYLDMLITLNNTTFNTHTQIPQTFSQHIHTYNHTYTTRYTHLLVLLLIFYNKILSTNRFHILVIPSSMGKCTNSYYINKIDKYIKQKHCTSYIKKNMSPKNNTNPIPSNTTLKAKPTSYHTNLKQLYTQHNTTPPLHTDTTSKTLTLHTQTHNAHFPQTNKLYLLQCPKTTTHTNNPPKTNLPTPQLPPNVILTTPKPNNINTYLTYTNYNTHGKITRLKNKKHQTTTYKVANHIKIKSTTLHQATYCPITTNSTKQTQLDTNSKKTHITHLHPNIDPKTIISHIKRHTHHHLIHPKTLNRIKRTRPTGLATTQNNIPNQNNSNNQKPLRVDQPPNTPQPPIQTINPTHIYTTPTHKPKINNTTTQQHTLKNINLTT